MQTSSSALFDRGDTRLVGVPLRFGARPLQGRAGASSPCQTGQIGLAGLPRSRTMVEGVTVVSPSSSATARSGAASSSPTGTSAMGPSPSSMWTMAQIAARSSLGLTDHRARRRERPSLLHQPRVERRKIGLGQQKCRRSGGGEHLHGFVCCLTFELRGRRREGAWAARRSISLSASLPKGLAGGGPSRAKG